MCFRHGRPIGAGRNGYAGTASAVFGNLTLLMEVYTWLYRSNPF